MKSSVAKLPFLPTLIAGLGCLMALVQPAEAQFTFTTNNGAITITSYTGSGGAVTIPSTTNGYPVTCIGSGAFIDTDVTSVMIPASITNIEIIAFYQAWNLTAITADTNNAFYSSTNGVLFDKNQKTLVAYPPGLSGNYAIPSSVTSIGDNAFYECYGLNGVTIGADVTSIGDEAFGEDTSMAAVTIPDSVTSIGISPFDGCSSLTAITVNTNNPAFISNAGILFNESGTTLIEYPAGNVLSSYAVPGNVITIAQQAFGGCKNLASVTIPASVTTIGSGAFAFSVSLTNVTIGNGVTSIGSEAFWICTSLTSVTIGNSVSSIGAQSFADTRLASVTIPASVTSIGTVAFSYCPSLTNILFQGNAPTPSNDSSVFSGDGNATAYYYAGTSGWGATFDGIPTVELATTLTVTTTSLANGTNGLAYSQTLTAAGGQMPYSWSLAAGGLPAGLILATNGLISGAPTANGTFNFKVKVTDTLSATATQSLSLTVGSPPSVSWLQPTNGSIAVAAGSNVTLAVSVSGTGPLSYQWQLNGTNLPSGTFITTVAGNGTAGYSGDGGMATNAELDTPNIVAADATGDLFIADTFNDCVRKVDRNGIITTVAGNGTAGYSGDGGAATNAELNAPDCVAVDAAHNLYIADSSNERIRKVGTNGIITTVAGNGYGAGSGTYDGGYSGDGGAATNAELNWPSCVAVDATGNLFISDSYNNCIRKVGTNGIITTVAGNGYGAGTGYGSYSGDGGAATNAGLSFPIGVAVDASGNLFIADCGNSRIREVGTQGIITTSAGDGTAGYSGDGGAATNAELNYPNDVTVDANGNLFIADSANMRIRGVGTGSIITTVAGNGYGAGTGYGGYSGDGGAATNAELNFPIGVAADANGNLLIADSQNNRIRKVLQGPTLVLSDVGLGNAGTYDVVVSSPYGSVTSSVVNLIVTLPNTVQYTASPTGGAVPLSVQFAAPGSDSAGNAITRWNWAFGDGSTGTNQNPLHIYASAGTFQPILMATNNLGEMVVGSGPEISVHAAPVNLGLVSNGGFETGDFTSWTLTGSDTNDMFVDDGSQSGIDPHSGDYLAACGPVGSLSYLSQALSTTPGAEYLLSFWLNSPDGQPTNEFLVSWNGSTLLDQTDLPEFGWTNLQFVVTATGASTVLQFGFRNDPSYFGLDDVSVFSVSAPPQLTGAGFNATGGFQISFSGQIGQAYTLQASTTLVNWVSILNFICTNSPMIVVDPAAKEYNHRFYRLVRGTPPSGVQVTTTALPNGTEGVPYSQILAAAGGQTPYSWTLSAGALPGGLTLATNGVISGTPTNSGTFNFTVQVTDAWSETATQALALFVTTSAAITPEGMALIPGGTFTMGDVNDGNTDGDAASMNIYVSAFCMDTNLVSDSQWQAVYGWAVSHGYGFVNAGTGKAPNHPVQTVDWYDVVKWNNARSQQAGVPPVYYTDANLTQVYTNGEPEAVYVNWTNSGYRLPTEAEWEKAARGGLSGQRFPWGDLISETNANYDGEVGYGGYDLGPNGYNAAFTNGAPPYTSPVGSFAANGYGLYDLAGNVFEWCWDWWGTPYGQPTTNNPTGPGSGSYRVARGGGWDSYAYACRAANRAEGDPAEGDNDIGFRSVLVLPSTGAPPFITAAPTNVTASAGTPATFSVTATGSQPLAYQWYFDGSSLPGATNASYTIASVQPANGGAYTVAVSNAYGSSSAMATLTVTLTNTGQILFMSEYFNGTIYDFSPEGVQSTFASGLDGSDAIAFDSAGNLFVANENGNSITEITPGGAQSTFASGVLFPLGLAFNGAGDLFVSSGDNIYEFAPDGAESTFSSLPSQPFGLAFSSAGNLFAALPYINEVIEITPDGAQSVFASGLDYPNDLAFDSAGNLFVADGDDGTIIKITPGGGQSVFASGLDYPAGIAFNAAGDLFEADYSGNIYEFTPAGVQSTFASGLVDPQGLCFSVTTTNPGVPPTITTPPASQAVVVGNPVTLGVVASGTPPLMYQWYFGGTPLPGATNTTYNIAGVQAANGGTYAVVVTNVYGSAAAMATLTVMLTNSVLPAGWLTPDKDVYGSRNGGYAAISVDVSTYTNAWTLAGASMPLTGDVLGNSNSQLVANLPGGIGIFDGRGTQLGFISTGAQLACLADVNGDGVLEILAVQMDTNDDFQILVYQANGTLLKTIQMAGTGQGDQTITPMFAADLNGDGQVEIVSQLTSGYGVAIGGVRGWEVTSYATGQRLWRNVIGPVPDAVRWTGEAGGNLLAGAWGPGNGNVGADGTSDSANYTWSYPPATGVAGWIRSFDSGGFYDSDVYLPDLNGDGTREIVATTSLHNWSLGDYGYGGIHLLDPASGTDIAAVNLGHYLDFRNAAFGNLDGVPGDELVVATYEGTTPFLRTYGSNLVVKASYSRASGMFAPVAVADLAGTGVQQVLAVYQPTSGDDRLVILDGALTQVLWEEDLGFQTIQSVAVDRLNQDGSLAIVVAVANASAAGQLIVLEPSSLVIANPAVLFTYTTNNNSITITGYIGTNPVVNIPSAINGYPVTSIGEGAFFENPNLATVTIPDSVTSIGELAFGNCFNLTGVTLPNSLTSIGYQAFYSCASLSSVTLPNSITNIGGEAFVSCSLTNVTIPGSVTSIGYQAFYDLSLVAITVDSNNSSYLSVAGVLFNKTQTTLIQYPATKGGKSYTIPNTVTSIGGVAFVGSSLTNLIIPNGVTNIGQFAFADSSLMTVTIPASLTSFGMFDYAFQNCPSLIGAWFQGNAPGADSTLFEYDNNVTAYYLPGTTGWNAFSATTGVPVAPWFLPQPLVLNNGSSLGVQSNQFCFTVSWATNASVVVQACTNIADPVWLPVATGTLSGGTFNFSDPNWTNYHNRFYRISAP